MTNDKPAARELPKCPSYAAHPQSVWFETHWLPIFDQLTQELTAVKESLKLQTDYIESVLRSSERERDALKLTAVKYREALEQVWEFENCDSFQEETNEMIREALKDSSPPCAGNPSDSQCATTREE